MEGKNVRSIGVMLIVVLMGMFIGQISASGFGVCYKACVEQCALTHLGPAAIKCPFICLKQCLAADSSSNERQSYCKMGCAVSNCLKGSTPQHPRAGEVDNCVKSCSNECTKPF